MPGYIIFSGLMLLLFTSAVQAAVLVAVDDSMGVPLGQPLQVEPFGVLENDTLDGASAGESGASAELVSSVSHGTLSCPTDPLLELCPDGSFDYLPDLDPADPSLLPFTGTDSFTYRAVFGADVSAPVTVTLTACTGGPDVLSCWLEAPYLDKLTELGYGFFREGFEGTAWDSVRSSASSTVTAPSITNMGITWTSNHAGTNDITTGAGAALTGLWGAYDPDHGYATGSESQCDIDNPPTHCLYHDGLSGRMATGGNGLLAVGGYITGIYGSKIAILLDGVPYDAGSLQDTGHHFFGVIDATGGGFTSFEFRELDGKIGQQNLIWADDFNIAAVDVNQAPVLAPIGNQSVNENELLSILLTASDPDGDNLSFSVSGAPTGSSLVDNFDGTANFSWTPEAGWAGIYPVSFVVTDDGAPVATDSEEISIVVGIANQDCTDVYSVISIDTSCIGSSSITVHSGVIVRARVKLALSAPVIHFMNDVKIESEAILQVVTSP